MRVLRFKRVVKGVCSLSTGTALRMRRFHWFPLHKEIRKYFGLFIFTVAAGVSESEIAQTAVERMDAI